MLVPIGAAVVALLFVLAAVTWSRRSSSAPSNRSRATSDPPVESVRVDLGRLRTIPSLAAAVDSVEWSKLEKRSGDRIDVGGTMVFGPKRLTWTPDDRARALGVTTWSLPWTDVAGGSVTTATSTTSAVLSLTLASGESVELVGVDEPSALAALRRLPIEG